MRPELHYWMTSYLKAFWVLCSRRTYGMGPNPISFNDMVVYCQMYEFEDLDEFVTLMCSLDETWMEVMAKRTKKT